MLAGNWKLNKLIGESTDFVDQLQNGLGSLLDRDCVVCPPYTALWHVSNILKGSDIHVGAQDLFWEDSGAFTGEVSGKMLCDVGCQFVIIGHSERRKIFHESDAMVNQKIKHALKNGLIPIVCLGETLEEREQEITFDVVKSQLEKAFESLDDNEVSTCILAYEPIWAIGTGKNATPEQANEVHAYLREQLQRLYHQELSENIRIQYGGSVNAKNIDAIMAQPDIDGALVGGASLDLQSFIRIVQFQN
ncbi:MAG: triose-phosphate isomerase [Chlamydiota bacterium]|nr:triose-phosphate isomerase [Chlamydiota bacterium]